MDDSFSRRVFMACLAGSLAKYSDRNYRELPELPEFVNHAQLPMLSIIVPARNEASNLQRLLPSLATISYPGRFEVIVVDDNSTDETTLIARDYGAQVIRLNNLPKNWAGKTYACHQGALAAAGDWFLFTDADTIHDSLGPSRSVSYASANGYDGLSVFIKYAKLNGVDSLIWHVAFAGLFLGLGSIKGVLNGQYILLHRDVYEKSGGFSSVAGESMEDLALGRHLLSNGYQVPFIRSDNIASVQSHSDIISLWQALVRIGAGSLHWLGARSIIAVLFIAGVISPILILISSINQRGKRKWALVSWATIALGFVPWAKRFGSGWLAVLAPIGALMLLLASVWGLFGRLLGRGTRWKGRRI